MKWLEAARARLRLLASRGAEARMNKEFRLHIELETEKLMREHGLAHDEARRRALIAFGGVENHKETLRDGRRFAWVGSVSLDLKIAIRMLTRYPWLTLVGCAAMAFGITVAVGAFEIRTQMVDPSIPLDEGSRIVGFKHLDTSRSRPVLPTAYDFVTWRDALTAVDDLSAVSVLPRNLITDDGESEAVDVAAMTASAFRVARVPPQLGRSLVEADEDPGAPPVVVISHEIWNRRFFGDAGVVGRTVRLGSERTTVVGVMPAGFAFPARHHVWIPLRIPAAGAEPGQGPGLVVFGRLHRDASRAQAQAELLAIDQRIAAAAPKARAHLQPQLVPYAWLFFDPRGIQWPLAIGNVFVVMLLVLVSANVGLLTFARAAARESEIAVRSALGAGRARIVAQLFVEGFALAALAVVTGLGVAQLGIGSLLATLELNSGRPLPFWMSDRLNLATVIYAGALTILVATVISVLPALKATSRELVAGLRQSMPGNGGFRFGGVWTPIIASQVAVTLAFPVFAYFFHRVAVGARTGDLGFPSASYLSTRLEIDRESAPGVPIDATEQAFRSRVRRTYAELERRLMSEPEVAGITFADSLPGTRPPGWRIEVAGENARDTSVLTHRVASVAVAVNFFEALGAPILSGRAFTLSDVESNGAVIVNQSFVTLVLGGRNSVGRRIRRLSVVDDDAQKPGPWLEVVGVVRNLGIPDDLGGVYQPVSPDTASVLRVAIGVRGAPESFASRLRVVASEVDPALQVHELMPLDRTRVSGWIESQYLSKLATVLSAMALLLSLTAIYSVVSFTVSRRTREIGVRVALGADRRRILGPILRRPLAQVGVGAAVGGILVALLVIGPFETPLTMVGMAAVAAYSTLMMGVCLLACVVPMRRALGLAPALALRVER